MQKDSVRVEMSIFLMEKCPIQAIEYLFERE
jgi:hypothetical protein